MSKRHMAFPHSPLNRAFTVRSVQFKEGDFRDAEFKVNVITGIGWELICRIRTSWKLIGSKEYYIFCLFVCFIY